MDFLGLACPSRSPPLCGQAPTTPLLSSPLKMISRGLVVLTLLSQGQMNGDTILSGREREIHQSLDPKASPFKLKDFFTAFFDIWP